MVRGALLFRHLVVGGSIFFYIHTWIKIPEKNCLDFCPEKGALYFCNEDCRINVPVKKLQNKNIKYDKWKKSVVWNLNVRYLIKLKCETDKYCKCYVSSDGTYKILLGRNVIIMIIIKWCTVGF